MGDIKDLIETVLGDQKLREGKVFGAGLYRDEPILKTAAQMKEFTPPIFREMRKLAGEYADSYYSYCSPGELFYRQGKLMESFEDDFDYHGQFVRYFPTYQAMNDFQLRGYFSWRTKARRGEIRETSLSFVFVYFYELLNGIGVSTAREGFDAIQSFWTAYREIDKSIDRYARLWIRDYVVYYGLERELLEEISQWGSDRLIQVLDRPAEADEDTLFSAVEALSTYRFDRSRFYRKYPEEVKTVVCGVLRKLTEYYEKHRKRSLCEKLFGRGGSYPYLMFQSAVFFDRMQYQSYEYQVSGLRKFTCRNGKWRCQSAFSGAGPSKELGALLKTIEAMLREAYEFPSPLKPAISTKLVLEMIEKEIEKLLEEKRRYVPPVLPKVEIDLSRLEGIREAALLTQEKLLTEEEQFSEKKEVFREETAAQQGLEPRRAGLVAESYVKEYQFTEKVNESAENALEDSGLLSPVEKEFLSLLLKGESVSPLLKREKLMLSLLADQINEKLFDHFGDTVLIFDGEEAALIEDYEEELKGMVEG